MTYTVNARAGLNLRAAPSTTAAILRALPYGTEVESLADPVGGWRSVRVAGSEGYCADAYLTLAQVTAYATARLNLRRGAGLAYDVLAILPTGASVTYNTDTTTSANGYQWRKVNYQGADGYVAIQFLTLTPPPPPPPVTTGRGHLMGLHKHLGGVGNEVILGMAQRLKAAGKPLEVVVVVSDPGLANALVPLVRRVVYRWQAGTAVDNPDYGSYPAGTDWRAAGAAWMAARWSNYSALDPTIFIQPINEDVWHAADAPFWLGILDFLEAKGRRAACFADAVGNPDDAGISADLKWKARGPVFERAASRGHVIACHIYSAPGTPEGKLSTDLINYELRVVDRLYNQLPANSRPDLLILEAAREFTIGRFTSATETLTWLQALQSLLKRYAWVKAIAAWTAGRCPPFEEASIDAALPDYEQAILAGRFP